LTWKLTVDSDWRRALAISLGLVVRSIRIDSVSRRTALLIDLDTLWSASLLLRFCLFGLLPARHWLSPFGEGFFGYQRGLYSEKVEYLQGVWDVIGEYWNILDYSSVSATQEQRIARGGCGR
jgi:hypothetical protein